MTDREKVLEIINTMMYLNGQVGKKIEEHHISANCGGGDPMDNSFEWFMVHQMCGLEQEGYIPWDKKVGEVIDDILEQRAKLEAAYNK